MPKQIYVNLPVKDLKKSIEFFTALGFSFNPQFTDDKAACMIINDGSIYAMLLTESFFKTFTRKEVADATQTTEVLLALDVDSRGAVDEMINKAVAGGGVVYREADDHGWMYQRCFADPDGHQWEIVYMDMSKLPQ